ncbi:hypothetical protein O181_054457 [Austropuccinia psidii MF-1]|uniref:Uncharacterized protein n=1 Tax=Austropuccinia psidii MF-1 TaxID=1389203 RepID=A0A9Q3EBR1_9BASI|nr:hypothetical protein [Austropuccinia psidii MF-1]
MYWRSNQIDEGYKNLQEPQEPKGTSIENTATYTRPSYCQTSGFGNIPNKIPENWVAPDGMVPLTEVEKRRIKIQEPVDLSPEIEHLRGMTRRPNVTQSLFLKR